MRHSRLRVATTPFHIHDRIAPAPEFTGGSIWHGDTSMPTAKRTRFRNREPGDTTPFNNANTMLEGLSVRYWRPSLIMLKIGKVGYYPSTGRIFVDGERKARSKRGLEALKALLTEERARLRVYVDRRAGAAEKQNSIRRERNGEALASGDPKAVLLDLSATVEAALAGEKQPAEDRAFVEFDLAVVE